MTNLFSITFLSIEKNWSDSRRKSELNSGVSIKRSQISHEGITRKNVIRVKSEATAAATEAGSLPFCAE